VNLPEHPDLDWLRKQAKRLLKELRETNPSARLADAQFDLARRYGFSSWRALKAHIDALTVDPLVAASLEQADRAEPTVKAAALLHLARVVNALDRAKGEQVLNRGLAAAAALREPERSVILGEGVSLAAVLSPARALEVASLVTDDDRPDGMMTKALHDMMSHGHEAAAVEYVAHAPTESFPFDHAHHVLGHAADEATRIAIVRRAIAAARAQDERGGSALRGPQGFPRFFAETWRLLPQGEAREVLQDLVDRILAKPDGRMRASWNDARFSSSREFQLFELFAPLRQLLPDVAARLAGECPQLAAALERYPDGAGSLIPAPPPAAPPPREDEAEQPDYILIGSRLIPMPDAVRSGFDEPFEIALRRYAADSDPRRRNDAPQECWPSAYEFRNILFKAGQHEGKAAARHLDRIPDPNLRLFAQIELAAALVGLPQMGGRTIEPGPAGFRASIAGRAAPPVPAPSPFVPPPPARRPDVAPSYDVQITPTRHSGVNDPRGPSGGSGPDFWVIEAATLRPVIARLWGVPESRIDVPASIAGRRYDFTLVLPRAESRETMTRLMREGVEKHFRVTRETLSMEVDVLTAPRGIDARETHADDRDFGFFGSFSFVTSSLDGPPAAPEGLILGDIMDLHMVAPKPGSARDGGPAAMDLVLQQSLGSNPGMAIDSISQSLTMEQLCRLLESGHDRPIIDETGLTAAYDINVHSEARSTREFMTVLCDALGLRVIPGRRDVEILLVREKG
jgi:uncharacterized protein (TIGR03435 family)